jgi:hypothetical protein
LAGEVIDCVQSYKYLGVQFSASGLFTLAQEESYKKGLKAYFMLTKITQNLTSGSTYFHLFDSTVKPVLLYGAEVWGLNNPPSRQRKNKEFVLEQHFTSQKIEDLNIKMCRHFLGLHKRSTKLAIYGETGRLPLFVHVLVSAVQYLKRLEKTQENMLLKEALMCNKSLYMKNGNCWYTTLSSVLKEAGLNMDSVCSMSAKKLTSILQSRFSQYWKESVHGNEGTEQPLNLGKLSSYKKFKTTNGFEPYLDLIKNTKSRSCMARFRTSAHMLNIEMGRYQRVPRENRKCTKCEKNVVEDETHFLVTCPNYLDQRELLYGIVRKRCVNFDTLHDEAKFIWIMSAEDVDIVLAVGRYLATCFEVRERPQS